MEETVEQENAGEEDREGGTRGEEDTRERNAVASTAREKKNGASRSRAIGAFARGRIGFNIKRFYEPNKKAINRPRLDRRVVGAEG